MSASSTASRTIEVALSQNPYPVQIAAGGLAQLGAAIREQGVRSGSRVLVVTNPVVASHYAERVLASLQAAQLAAELLVIEAGEDQKTPATVAVIHDAAFRQRLERSSLIVALGGGVVGDMAGFAAATWLRGIAVVQVPTTLLAMVDASIGGKTGVNHPGGESLMGAFHQPKLVLIDPTVLASLPVRELRAGMAEVIKYGVIGDAALFEELEATAERQPENGLASLEALGPERLERILASSAAAKARVVAADEREGGLRAILNYGHTIGHAVETLCGYGTWLHGEAVAIGMVAAGAIAERMGLWSAADQQRQSAVIRAAGLPLQLPALDSQALLDALQSDKKVRDGRLRFVLPEAIGRVTIRDDVSAESILSLLKAAEGAPLPA
ncbi:MAG: 3-dehydroquinate synthase [Synechococcaceae cyanobacterium]|nr:3-dehydroquinate synthase [Synechococcaceae cyanobacterium]